MNEGAGRVQRVRTNERACERVEGVDLSADEDAMLDRRMTYHLESNECHTLRGDSRRLGCAPSCRRPSWVQVDPKGRSCDA